MKTPAMIITRKVQEEIVHSLRAISCPPHVKGYSYIKTALEIVLRKPESIEFITGELYPEVATLHQTTPSRVERAIRHAVELLYDRNGPNHLNELLGPPSYSKGKLTNSEFLAVMAERIRMDLDHYAEPADEVPPEVCKDVAEEERLAQLRKDLITLGVLTPCTQKGTQA